MADAKFEDPRLAQVYDPLDPDRGDLDVYVAMVDELGVSERPGHGTEVAMLSSERTDAKGVRSVLDVGCGTGTFACLLAGRGIAVTAVDPAAASLDVASSKPGAEAVRWIHGDSTTLPPLRVDAAFMTGNVAQVFVTDGAWMATLRAIRAALRPGGILVFETRVPAMRAWERWTPELTRRTVDIPGVGIVESWEEVTDVGGELVTFRSMTAFRDDDLVLESTSTLRFRDRGQIEPSLEAAGLDLVEVREAPDRPGLEHVFLARRPAS